MQRDRLLLAEMIDACLRIIDLCRGVSGVGLEADANRRDALLWNFTVLGEAASQVSDRLKAEHPDVGGRRRCRAGSVCAQWRRSTT